MLEIIGLKVIAIKGNKYNYNNHHRVNTYVEPIFILFDDGETYIELEEQDYYTYHDCSRSARHIRVFKNK